jgi:hypothetical protein
MHPAHIEKLGGSFQVHLDAKNEYKIVCLQCIN